MAQTTLQVPEVLHAKLKSVDARATQVNVLAGAAQTLGGFLAVMGIAIAVDWSVSLFNPAVICDYGDLRRTRRGTLLQIRRWSPAYVAAAEQACSVSG